MTISITSRKVGARNPFALAEKINGRKINWFRKSPDSTRSTLFDVFDVPCEKLFDSRNKKSPLFRKVGDAASPIPCFEPDFWDVYKVGGTAVPYSKKDPYNFDSRDIRDTVQGILPNCPLMAALASIAWKRVGLSSVMVDPQPTTLNQKNHPNTPYEFDFYDGNGVYSQYTTNLLPLDKNRNLFHGRSSANNEIWPCLFEKAYYQWREHLKGNETATPDYCLYGMESPYVPLSHLTSATNPIYKYTQNSTSDNVFSDIYNYCSSGRCSSDRIINYPAIAWTFDPNLSNPNKVTYTNSTIVANHCYSLLGLYAPKNPGGTFAGKYMILRNPWGPQTTLVSDDPAVPPVPRSGESSIPSWVGTWNTIDLSANDGIFAFSAEQFWKYFEGYAWVT